MAAVPTIDPSPHPSDSRREKQLARRREQYVYRDKEENQLAPIATAKSWPWLREQYGPSWLIPFVPGYLRANIDRIFKLLRSGLQCLAFNFDKMEAYKQLFLGALPRFAEQGDDDQVFAYRRLAGANALAVTQELTLATLLAKIPIDVPRIERRLAEKLGREVSVAEQANAGRLFIVDFRLLQSALPLDRTRDSRWRDKYMATSIGVFLEAPGFYQDTDLVVLAIQIDQSQPNSERNPVYYPDGSWGWKIAKAYFESASVSFHSGAGHIFRTHLLLEPFCMATPRQLPEDHPVYMLLRPHTRFTLAANAAAYRSFTHRANAYYEFHSGTLEETRNISIQDYMARDFRQLQLNREFASRGVEDSPADYPYRDDALLWVDPIQDFVSEYIDAFYEGDDSVRDDRYLQSWFEELVDPARGALRNLVPEGRMDSKQKLIDLLSQVVYTAGPGHASQHFASSYFYRYSPATPAATYAPPPWKAGEETRARYENTLPTLRAARDQFMYNTFTNYKYDTFGNYDRYPIGELSEAREPIRRLQVALVEIEDEITEREKTRILSYDFLRPSVVPNSANI